MTDLEMLMEVENELERLIDAHGLRNIVHSLSVICFDKAAHIEHSWQDYSLARVWTNAAKVLDRASTETSIHRI